MERKLRALNILIAGHVSHGKSSLIESIIGKFPDCLDFELAHNMTISLKVNQFPLKKQDLLLNLMDSPGHADFQGSIALGLEFADLLVLVISGSEGFQARTYWLFEKAIERNIPTIIAVTKMDLPSANVNKIKNELQKVGKLTVPVLETSSKNLTGIEELIEKVSIYIKRRDKIESDLSFLVLGFAERKGVGELINIGILSGKLKSNQWISEKVKVRQIFNLTNAPIEEAIEGDIVQLALNVVANFELGAKYSQGKFISSKIQGLMAELAPKKEFYVKIENPEKFKIAIDILENLKKIVPSFDYYIDKNKDVSVLVLGDMQFEFIKKNLEDLIEFKVIGSKIKGVITINEASTARFKTASVRIAPRCKKILTVFRYGAPTSLTSDLIGASAAYESFHLDGLHVDVLTGKSEDDIAQAIAKAVENIKLIKLVPQQDVIVKVENFQEISLLLERYSVEVLYLAADNTFFLQIKNEQFEDFFSSLMKVSKGKAELSLLKFEPEEIVFAVDPGTRHVGFCLIEKGELPSLWFVNLKDSIDNLKSHNVSKSKLENELDAFLGNQKSLISTIYVGNGPGSGFVIDFLIEYLNIPCEDQSCVKNVTTNSMEKEVIKETLLTDQKARFKPPEIYLVDEFKTTKEALYHLQRGQLVGEVQSKGFVDHAIAALLIAKRGIKGEYVKIEKKPLAQLFDYIVDNYAGSYSFRSIHNINSLADVLSGMYLRIKDVSKLDTTSLNNGDTIMFSKFGTDLSNLSATTLTGNKIIVKFKGDVRIKQQFFEIFVPVKQN